MLLLPSALVTCNLYSAHVLALDYRNLLKLKNRALVQLFRLLWYTINLTIEG